MRSTVTGNTSTEGDGGGVFVSDADEATIANSTIDANKATKRSGGGVHVAPASVATTILLNNVTFSDNTAADGAVGALSVESGLGATVANSLFVKNASPSCGGGGSVTGGPNLVQGAGAPATICGVPPAVGDDIDKNTFGDARGDACDVCGPGQESSVECTIETDCPCAGRPLDGGVFRPWKGHRQWTRCVRRSCRRHEDVERKACRAFRKANRDCGGRDRDEDGIVDHRDNCPRKSNPGQEDCDRQRDEQRAGDTCDDDMDDDAIANAQDNCPRQPNTNQTDSDRDGIGDECDCCPFTGPARRTPNGCRDGEDASPRQGFAQFPSEDCDDGLPPRRRCYVEGSRGYDDETHEPLGQQ